VRWERYYFFALEFENKPTPPYTNGLGKVGNTSGSEHVRGDEVMNE
jgi:hypothetical protein